ncbi:DUF6542 domain-containing protein [Actinophytocola gossypii]|uniref:DUF6542 domain-containing protein n=1 Tax=Actinophytocola gossypii TaxID=2812003 RepID=A0ABT2J762_9PSEU|nr:DUF6542 domain-containing protein [Actinophytocola gossypii]MCT2583703.1 hypothetical protein [Actinophytocola gossypii]
MSTERSTGRWGLPWWAVALGATGLAAVGGWLGGRWFPVAVAAACVLAALVVRPDGYFTVVVQPPVVTGVVVAGTVLLGRPALSAAVDVSATFPYLLATMVAVGLVVLARVLHARRRVH